MADDYNVNIRFSDEGNFGGDTGSRAGAPDTGERSSGRERGQDREASDRKRIFQQMEFVFRAFRGIPGVGIIGTIGKDIANNSKFSQQALGLQKNFGGGLIAGLAGVALTLFSILKQSQISTKFASAYFQIIGAMIDMLLVPYIPLLSKIVEWLMKGFSFTSKYAQTIADLISGIAKYLWHMLQLAIIGNPVSLAIISAIKGFDYTKEVMSDIINGLQESKDSIINATKALFDIGKREKLTEQILGRLKEAITIGAPISNIVAAQEALLTMPTSILQEIMNSINEALEKSSIAKDGSVYIEEISKIANSLSNLKFPVMTASESVAFDKQWSDMLELGSKIKPRDIVDLAKENLITIKDIFDLSKKHGIEATSVIDVVGLVAKKAKDVIDIVKGSEIPVDLADMILKFKNQIVVDAEKVITIAKSEKTLADFIDVVHKLLLKDYISDIGIVLGDYIKDKTLLNDILTAAGISLESDVITVIENGLKETAKSLGDNKKGILGSIVMALGEAAGFASQISSYIAAAIEKKVAERTAKLNAEIPWDIQVQQDQSKPGSYGGTFPIVPPVYDPNKIYKGHTGRLITESGIYNLLRGERVVREGDTNRLVTVNNNITVISSGNQTLMPGILGKSLQSSLMEGLEGQLVRSLT